MVNNYGKRKSGDCIVVGVVSMHLIRKLFDPTIYQGKSKKKNYFEGWYYKLINKEQQHALAVIPGVSFGNGTEDRHAFIQLLDTGGKVSYIRYELSDFSYRSDRFEVAIGDNYFSDREMRLNIVEDHFNMVGQLTFHKIIAFPKSLKRPGIMGPYTFIPFMECNHGIVNIHHEISGRLNIHGNEADFSGGYGYIEKDWGRSFPETWVWLQSNHFGSDDVTIMFSAAKIPWMGRFFPGFISFIRIKDRIILFATYTGAKIIDLTYRDDQLVVVLEDKRYRMEIRAKHSEGGILKAPKNGLMDHEILESISAVVLVTLSDKRGLVVYSGTGTHAGLEIANEMIFSLFRTTT